MASRHLATSKRGRRPLPPPVHPKRPTNLRELAGAIGITYKRAQRLRMDGLPIERDGTYDLAKARRFLQARAARGQDISGGSTTAFLAKQQKLTAEAKLKELELARELEEVVDKGTVVREWRRRQVQFRNRMMGLARELAPRLLGKGIIEMQAIITESVAERLRILGHDQYAKNT